MNLKDNIFEMPIAEISENNGLCALDTESINIGYTLVEPMVILTEKMKVGPKGQVVIPVSFRKRYNIFPGDEVMFEEKENGMMITKPEVDVIALMRKSAAEIGHVGPIDSNKEYEEEIEKRLKRAGL